jgi:hypothetical protein
VWGILFTCSAFGPAINRVKAELNIPVLHPNESAFRAPLKMDNRIGLLLTFAPSAKSLTTEMHSIAEALHQTLYIKTVVVEETLM